MTSVEGAKNERRASAERDAAFLAAGEGLDGLECGLTGQAKAAEVLAALFDWLLAVETSHVVLRFGWICQM